MVHTSLLAVTTTSGARSTMLAARARCRLRFRISPKRASTRAMVRSLGALSFSVRAKILAILLAPQLGCLPRSSRIFDTTSSAVESGALFGRRLTSSNAS